jgi:hypothetical protein
MNISSTFVKAGTDGIKILPSRKIVLGEVSLLMPGLMPFKNWNLIHRLLFLFVLVLVLGEQTYSSITIDLLSVD